MIFLLFKENDIETVALLGWKDVDEYMYADYEPDHHIVEQGKATYREVTEEKEKAILDAFKHNKRKIGII